MDDSPEITQLLLAWEQGDQSALEQLIPLVQEELRRLASGFMRKERKGHLLQTTALVNEAYLRLAGQNHIHWQNRNQFFALAATCMRRILLDYARSQGRDKRGGDAQHIALSDAPPLPDDKAAEIVALDEALRELEKQDASKSRIVELRYFGGYTVEEVAEILGVPKTTIEREWRMARAWLQRELDATPKTARADDL